MGKVLWAVAVFAVLLSASSVQAATISWVDWTTYDGSSTLTGTAGGVGVTFVGDPEGGTAISGFHTDWTPSGAYVDGVLVENAPPTTDIIQLFGGAGTGTQTITFAQAVVDPVMAIVSLGRSTIPVRYVFDRPVTIVSNGVGNWGSGPAAVAPANVLTGNEYHGTVMFSGTMTSISWTMPDREVYHDITVGITAVAPPGGPAAVPLPSGVALLGLGLFGLGLARVIRRRRAS